MEHRRPQAFEELRRVRDEIRVKMHLAELDARTWWAEVEPMIANVERKLEIGSERAVEYANVLTDELSKALARARDRLGELAKS
jgi:hypothetical protein